MCASVVETLLHATVGAALVLHATVGTALVLHATVGAALVLHATAGAIVHLLHYARCSTTNLDTVIC